MASAAARTWGSRRTGDMALRERQSVIYDANEGGRVKPAGSYFHSKQLGQDLIGSHEAAFSAGSQAAAEIPRELS
ncbi:hypothetical protein [Streptomyces sp. NPDC001165]|uniref:hypothetical protein n=1 Tax=Streptomyces sp. NPDC001165 TaxID=3364546 RepID=UPI0036B58480